MQLRFLYGFVVTLLTIFFLTCCSASSQSDRYNRPSEKEEKQSSSVRFTSSEGNDTSTIYNIPNDLEEFDEIPIEDVPVDTKEFIGKYERMESLSSALTTREKILLEIISYLDTPYKYGGVDRNGIDCSAFTLHVFNTAIGLELPRTSSEQFNFGELISSRSDLAFGDLLFFNTTRRSYPGHVGIYIGENLFAHASRSLGVTVSSLESSYYKKRYIGARRIK